MKITNTVNLIKDADGANILVVFEVKDDKLHPIKTLYNCEAMYDSSTSQHERVIFVHGSTRGGEKMTIKLPILLGVGYHECIHLVDDCVYLCYYKESGFYLVVIDPAH